MLIFPQWCGDCILYRTKKFYNHLPLRILFVAVIDLVKIKIYDLASIMQIHLKMIAEPDQERIVKIETLPVQFPFCNSLLCHNNHLSSKVAHEGDDPSFPVFLPHHVAMADYFVAVWTMS